MNQHMKDAYWSILRECLVRFHGFSGRDAARRVEAYARSLDEAPANLPMDIAFNAEPFDVANDLAGHEVDWETHRNEYLAVMDHSYAAVSGADRGKNRPPGFLPAA